MIGRLSTIPRLSLGLVSLTITLILAAELLGLLPDQQKAVLEARAKIAEVLAVEVSSAAGRNDFNLIQTILTSTVEREDTMLSAALRDKDGSIVAAAGDHQENWEPAEDGRSTPTHVQVPIKKKQVDWGAVEISFTPLQSFTSFDALKNSSMGLLVFVGLVGFVLFFLYLRRALRELDPSAVIPAHVKSAFDALAEGVLIIDEKEQIVLANEAFSTIIEQPASGLTGRKASELNWLSSETGGTTGMLPWQHAMNDGKVHAGVALSRDSPENGIRTFIVNGAPIRDGKGKVRGALATFDDVSDLKRKNTDLEETLQHLAKSKAEVKRQNVQLHHLAMHDPLTGLLNRRALFPKLEQLFKEARRDSTSLCTIMIDIDHFKMVNDKYGHDAGDKVIRFVAKSLKEACRQGDLAARYGGEEFCIIMPTSDLETATGVAERLRVGIAEDFNENFSASIDLTVSLGIALLDDTAETANDLLNHADKALYCAKATGRNRVIRWGDTSTKSTLEYLREAESGPNHDETMLIQKFEDTQMIQTAQLSERVLELDAIIEEKSSELHRKHGFDELTGLPNRILFYDRLTQALTGAQRDGKSIAVLYLDIDLLRRVEDVVEPVMSDDLLREATDRLSSVLRNNQTVALLGHGSESVTISRLTNSEFGIALYDLASAEAVTWIIQRLFDSLSASIDVDGNEIYANCSVGVSLYPSDGNDTETLVRCASTARHHAHASLGRNTFRFYSEDTNERSYQQIQLENQLREAIKREEFRLYFQPEIDLKTGRSVVMEALIRWEHPEMGLIGPDMFIPIAENSGFISDVGDWVLRSACGQMKKWLDNGIDDIRVAVNLSAIQVQSDKLVENILGILDEVGLDPKYLELEVTETAMMDQMGKIDRALQQLRSRGVRVAIDDFGTGFSSLSHLKRLVVDSLKIDRTFIRDVTSDTTDAALVGAVIALAQSMDLRVVAEGVETQAQLDHLRELQCDIAQGYLLGHPVSVKEADELLKSGARILTPEGKPAKPSTQKVTELVASETEAPEAVTEALSSVPT